MTYFWATCFAAALVAVSYGLALAASFRFADGCFAMESWPCDPPYCHCDNLEDAKVCWGPSGNRSCTVVAMAEFEASGGSASAWRLLAYASVFLACSFLVILVICASMAFRVIGSRIELLSPFFIAWCCVPCFISTLCALEVVWTEVDAAFPVKVVQFCVYAALFTDASLLVALFYVGALLKRQGLGLSGDDSS